MRAASGLGRVVARASSIRPADRQVLRELLDDRHPLAAHAERGQHGERPAAGRRPFRYPGRRHPAAADVPVPGARAEPAQQVPEGRLLETGPRALADPPAPEGRGPVRPRAQPFHGVIQGPRERGLADAFPAVAGHPAGHVGPAGNHREQPAALHQGHPVALLEPQRAQDVRVQRRPAAGMLGVPGRHHRGLTGLDLRRVGGGRGRLVVGEPDRGDHGRLVVHVRGGGDAVVLHDQPSAAVWALAGEQDLGPARPGGEIAFSPAPAQSRHNRNLLIRRRSPWPHPGYC